MATYVKIKLRRDSLANWKSANPVLSLGEAGVDMDNCKIKIGNGSATWNDLPYVNDDVYGELEKIIKLIAGVTGNGKLRDPVANVGSLSTKYPNPVPGDIVFITSEGQYYVWNGSEWDPISGVGSGNGITTVQTKDGLSSMQPTPTVGSLVYVINEKKYYSYDGSVWTAMNTIAPVSSRPSNPYTGQIIFLNSDNKLYFWDGAKWVEVGGNNGSGITACATVADLTTQFTNPTAGMMAYVINPGKYYYYNGTSWNPAFDTISAGQVESLLAQKIAQFDVLGMGYQIANFDESSGMPIFYTFDDNTCMFIKWVENSTEYVEYISFFTSKDGIDPLAAETLTNPDVKVQFEYETVNGLKRITKRIVTRK